MKQKLLLLIMCVLAGSAPSFATRVTFLFGEGVCKLINKATKAETPLLFENYTATVDVAPGEYTYTENSVEKGWGGFADGSFDFSIDAPENYPDYSEEYGIEISIGGAYFRVGFSSEKDADGKPVYWKRDIDYTVENLRLLDNNGNEVRFVPAKSFNSDLEEVETDLYVPGLEGWTAEVDFVPTELHPNHEKVSYTQSLRPFGGNPNYVAFATKISFELSFPDDATAELSYKKSETHYVAFQKIEPNEKLLVDGKWIYKYTMGKDAKQYCYRVSRPGNMTRAGIFSPDKVDKIEITDETLASESEHYFDHEVWGNGTHYSDIFLNINKRHLLRLKKDDTFQIVNIRTWQLTNNATANYFVEPDYNWTVLNSDFEPDNSVIEVSDNGVITAKAPGTAIVQVRYTALGLGAMGGDKWSELWAENTGTFVVTVDADGDAAPDDNIRLAYKPDDELDAEHDILYFMEDAPGYYLTFTPAVGSTVAVANPSVDTENNTVAYPDAFSENNVTVNADGSVTALLTYGRNIIRTTDASGNSNYQVLSAKPITVEPFTARTDSYFLPGDDVKVQFKGLYHVSGKLAGIYNNNCHLHFNDYTVFKGTLIGAGQYDFAGNAVAQQFPFTFAADATDDYVMTGGCLVPEGYGASPGAHRAIDYTVGIDPNFNAGIVSGNFGIIPDQIIKLTQLKDAGRLGVTLEMGSRVLPVKMDAIHHAFGQNAGWVMDEGGVARVDNATGEVFPLKGGKTSMKVVANIENPATEALLVCDIEVGANDDFIPVDGISFPDGELKEIKMNFSWGNWGNMGNSVSCKVTPDNATNKRVIFTSSAPEFVALTKQGAASATTGGSTSLFWNDVTRLPGESVITAETVDGGYKAQIVVRWLRAADNISLNASSIELKKGDIFDLIAYVSPDNVDERYVPSWSSNDEKVATVDQDGKVTAVGIGEARITVRMPGSSYDVTASCTVTVSELSGIEDVAADNDGFAFWPHPAECTLYVRSAVAARAEIYTIGGGLVMTADLVAGTNTLDVSALSTGCYIIRVGDKAERLIRR